MHSTVQVGTPAASNSVARLEGTNADCLEAGKEVVVAFEARDAFGNTVSALLTASVSMSLVGSKQVHGMMTSGPLHDP